MNKPGFALLADVIMDPEFPDLDLALRRGRHVDRDDAAWYTLLSDAQEHLESFYKRYGCELIHKADGYYYLLPTGEKLSRKQLSVADMLVGQALALLYLDPATATQGGRLTQEELVTQLATVLGNDALIGLFNPKRKRLDERIAQKNVRNGVAAAVRRLAGLGFVESLEDDAMRMRPALMRFAEPVRAAEAPSEALAKLVAKGEVALVPDEDESAGADAYGSETSVGDVSAVETSVGELPAAERPAGELPAAERPAGELSAPTVDSSHALESAATELSTALPPNSEVSEATESAEADSRDLSWDDLFPVASPTPPAAAESASEPEAHEAAWGELFSAAQGAEPGDAQDEDPAVEETEDLAHDVVSAEHDADFSEEDVDFRDEADSGEDEDEHEP